MPSKAQITGKKGEEAAVHFLKRKGYQILSRNFRIRNAEVDIIAKEKDVLVFVEVKTRKSLKRGMPAESVDLTKQRKIGWAGLHYLKKKKLNNVRIRFDVVEVVLDIEESQGINLIRNAFELSQF